MKTIKLFAFLMAMAIAMPVAAQQVKVLGKSGNTSTTTTKKATTTTAKKSATPKQSSSASYSSDYSIEGWQGGAGFVTRWLTTSTPSVSMPASCTASTKRCA